MHMDGPLINIGDEKRATGESKAIHLESSSMQTTDASNAPPAKIECQQTASVTSTSHGRCDVMTGSEKSHSEGSSSLSMKHNRLKRDLSIDRQDVGVVRGDAAAMSAKDLKKMEAAECMYNTVCLVCLFVCLSVCLSVCMYVYLPLCLHGLVSVSCSHTFLTISHAFCRE